MAQEFFCFFHFGGLACGERVQLVCPARNPGFMVSYTRVCPTQHSSLAPGKELALTTPGHRAHVEAGLCPPTQAHLLR
jgi:hypothetical protein